MWKLLALFLIAPASAFALDAGDACSSTTKLPDQFACFDGEVYECRNRQGRMGYIACEGQRLRKLENEMTQRYERLLKSYDRQSENGKDFKLARVSLVKSQAAWERFARADCDLEGSLFGIGNASAGVSIDCRVGHVQARIARLKVIEESN